LSTISKWFTSSKKKKFLEQLLAETIEQTNEKKHNYNIPQRESAISRRYKKLKEV
jgi:hypothetical protein